MTEEIFYHDITFITTAFFAALAILSFIGFLAMGWICEKKIKERNILLSMSVLSRNKENIKVFIITNTKCDFTKKHLFLNYGDLSSLSSYYSELFLEDYKNSHDKNHLKIVKDEEYIKYSLLFIFGKEIIIEV